MCAIQLFAFCCAPNILQVGNSDVVPRTAGAVVRNRGPRDACDVLDPGAQGLGDPLKVAPSYQDHKFVKTARMFRVYEPRTIANLLNISIKNVEKHRANIMAKLDTHSAASLTAFAFEQVLAHKSA
ncbi:MAG: helix-turn-helix domain-containing protein [Desulfobacterales bacterium]|nr:helix-turn-helix domain-containing protein [Desulfobacterales bacterium]